MGQGNRETRHAEGHRPRRRRSIRIRSAGVAVVRWEAGQWRYLLLRAFQYWDFPKGQVEQGESCMEAAKREVEEETGITELRFHWGEDFIETGPYARGKVARYYLAETGQIEVTLGISPELGRPEHQEYRWVEVEQAMSLAAPRVQRVLEWTLERLHHP